MPYRFREFELDEEAYVLRREGRRLELEPKPLALLLYLLENHERTLSKQELLDALWPNITVSEQSLTRAARAVRHVLGEHGREAEILQTVRGRGYRIGVAVEVAAESAAPPLHPPLPDRPSLAVLPFTSLSEDSDHEHFADGLTEDLTADLCTFPQLFVIARSSAFTYKGLAVDVEQIGKELGVRYVVEGSVRRAGDRVRVVAQLIDATTGFHLWSGRYDRELSDIFAIQSEIAEEMLRALQVEIQEAEIERVRRKPTESLTAYEAWVKGRAQHWSYSAKDTEEARRLFERATLLDPGYAEAYAQLGNTYIIDFGQGRNLDPGLLERAEALARRALELDPLSPEGHITLAASVFPRGGSAEQVSAAERAVELAPNLDAANALLGLARLRQGRFEDAARLFELAERLNPRAPQLYWTLLGHAYRRSGRIEEAVALWERVRATDPEAGTPRIALAHHYQAVGRIEAAQALVAEILGVSPAYTAETAAQRLLSQVGQVADPEATAEIAEQLRKAGFP